MGAGRGYRACAFGGAQALRLAPLVSTVLNRLGVAGECEASAPSPDRRTWACVTTAAGRHTSAGGGRYGPKRLPARCGAENRQHTRLGAHPPLIPYRPRLPNPPARRGHWRGSEARASPTAWPHAAQRGGDRCASGVPPGPASGGCCLLGSGFPGPPVAVAPGATVTPQVTQSVLGAKSLGQALLQEIPGSFHLRTAQMLKEGLTRSGRQPQTALPHAATTCYQPAAG